MTNHFTTKHSSSQIQIPVNFPNQIIIEPSEHEHFKSQNPKSTHQYFDYLQSLKHISTSLQPFSLTKDFVTALFHHHHRQPKFLLFLFFLLALISPNFRMVHLIPISTKSSNTHYPHHPLTVPTNVGSRRQASATAAAAAFVIIEQISPSISEPLELSPQLQPQPPPWSCNFTAYPYEGCNILFEAYCDRESNTCVCDDHQTSSSNSGPKSTKKASRHRKRYCLGPEDLGKRCQSSGQCRVKDPNSACYAEKGFDDWRCMCADGFVEKDGKCETNPEYQKSDNPYERCAALGQVYVSVLERCLDRSHLPYYAHRSAGRAGGGRGGGSGGRGRGGVGGRGAGSRAWYSSDRNLMRKNSSNILRSNLLNIPTLSLISSYLIYLLATKHL